MSMMKPWYVIAGLCLLGVGQHIVGVMTGNPSSHQIIHVLNWHFIPKAMFAVALQDQFDEPITDDETDRQYAEFLDEVEAVQQEQMTLLRGLIQKHGVKHIFLEGFSHEQLPAFRKRIEALRKFQKHMPKGDSLIERLMMEEFRSDLLDVGAPGRLVIAGEVEVLPANHA